MTAKQRITEFIRQWKMGNFNGDKIHGVCLDPKASEAELLVSDLQELLDRVT